MTIYPRKKGAMTISVFILNLNPCYDHWVILKQKPPIENVMRGDRVVKLVNGKGMDIGRVFNTIGFDDYLCINILGGQVGQIIETQYQKEGLRCDDFWISDESRINTAVVHEYKNTMEMINEPGPIMTPAEIAGFSEFIAGRDYFKKEKIKPDDFLVISGSAPRGFNSGKLVELLDFFQSLGMKIAVDIAGEWLKKIITKGLDLLKINGDELRVAFDINDNDHSAIETFRKENRIGLLIITHGEKGSVAYSQEGVIKAVPKNVSTNFAVGSGDSYFAGLLYSIEKGEPLSENIRFAASCGLSNTFHYGAGIMKREEIFDNLKKINVTEVAYA